MIATCRGSSRYAANVASFVGGEVAEWRGGLDRRAVAVQMSCALRRRLHLTSKNSSPRFLAKSSVSRDRLF
jgi:hypothetical protein